MSDHDAGPDKLSAEENRPSYESPESEDEIRLLRTAIELSANAILFIDPKTMEIVDVNQAACRVFGSSRTELLHASLGQLSPDVPPEHWRTVVDAVVRRDPETAILETALWDPSGLDPVEWRIGAVSTRRGPRIVVVARPRQPSQSAPVRERGPSHPTQDTEGLDTLTGLPGRRCFTQRLSSALARSRQDPAYRFVVLFVDLDGFKAINDRLGHLRGDQVLCEAAQRLARSIRPGDLAARFGGDEFTVLLDDVQNEADGRSAAARIRTHLEQSLELDGHQLWVTASIGIAVSWAGYERVEEMLRDADRAMYRAKREGAGCVVFDQQIG